MRMISMIFTVTCLHRFSKVESEERKNEDVDEERKSSQDFFTHSLKDAWCLSCA